MKGVFPEPEPPYALHRQEPRHRLVLGIQGVKPVCSDEVKSDHQAVFSSRALFGLAAVCRQSPAAAVPAWLKSRRAWR